MTSLAVVAPPSVPASAEARMKEASSCMETVTCHYSTELQHHEELLLLTNTTASNTACYDVNAWVLYLDAIDSLLLEHKNKKDANQDSTARENLSKLRDWVGRRALKLLPRSLKLWKMHWEFVVNSNTNGTTTTTKNNTNTTIACFERACNTLHLYPRVWMEFLMFVSQTATNNSVGNGNAACLPMSVTHYRRTVNRALQAVALTQHGKVWSVVVPFLSEMNTTGASGTKHKDDDDDDDDITTTTTADFMANKIPLDTRICLLQRYAQFDASYKATLADFLRQHDRPGQAAACLYDLLLLEGEQGDGGDGESTQQHLAAFTDLVTKHSLAVEQAGVPWQAILRASLLQPNTSNNNTKQQQQQQTQLQGLVWTQLADAWIRRGAFRTARSVYEEGLLAVSQVRDFSIVYDAYLQFEEGLLQAAVAGMEQDDSMMMMEQEEEEADNTGNDDWDILLGTTATSPLADMELAVARAEHLTARRPLLLNQVLIRQNPHNVGEWLHRAELYIQQEQAGQAAAALEEALRTVHASRAVNGTPSELVVRLVMIYEESAQDVAAARDLLDRMCHQVTYAFNKSDDLAECWAAYVEFELRQERYDDALGLARQAVAAAAPGTRQYQLHLNLQKSLRLWDLLLDLEESLGSAETTKDAYNRGLEIKASTVQHVLNFATFLVEQKYFEESFTAYERGLELFAFPHAGAKLLWKAYLKGFTDRYKGGKVERTRDLYQRCLETCPTEESAEFFMMSGEFEEEYGLTKRALSVYRAMCQKVPATEKLVVYQLFIAKTIKYLGVTATRDIYQEAIEALDDSGAADMSLDFAKMETSLQQIDRARAILAYGAQMADPRRFPEYWKTWNEFEIGHGNEETFREMLRVKRSVEAAFSTVNYNATGMTDKVENLSNEEAMKMIASQEGVDAQRTTAVSGFVTGKRTAAAASLDDVEQRVAKLRKATAGAAEDTPPQDDENDNEDDDEIDIEDIDAEIEAAAAEGAAAAVQDVSTKSVPAAVFGGLTSTEDSKAGALERLRAAKK